MPKNLFVPNELTINTRESSASISEKVLKDETIESIVEVLNQGDTLTSLSFDQCEISAVGFEKLTKLKFVTSIFLKSVNLDNERAIALVSQGGFAKLRLQSCGISEAGLLTIASAVKITSLELAYLSQPITDRIATELAKHRGLVCLTLDHNLIDENSILALCKSQTIESLTLRANKLTKKIRQALVDNKVLKNLNLYGSEIKASTIKKIIRSKTIISLELNYDKLKIRHIRELAYSKRLVKLVLPNLYLDTDMAKLFLTNNTICEIIYKGTQELQHEVRQQLTNKLAANKLRAERYTVDSLFIQLAIAYYSKNEFQTVLSRLPREIMSYIIEFIIPPSEKLKVGKAALDAHLKNIIKSTKNLLTYKMQSKMSFGSWFRMLGPVKSKLTHASSLGTTLALPAEGNIDPNEIVSSGINNINITSITLLQRSWASTFLKIGFGSLIITAGLAAVLFLPVVGLVMGLGLAVAGSLLIADGISKPVKLKDEYQPSKQLAVSTSSSEANPKTDDKKEPLTQPVKDKTIFPAVVSSDPVLKRYFKNFQNPSEEMSAYNTLEISGKGSKWQNLREKALSHIECKKDDYKDYSSKLNYLISLRDLPIFSKHLYTGPGSFFKNTGRTNALIKIDSWIDAVKSDEKSQIRQVVSSKLFF